MDANRIKDLGLGGSAAALILFLMQSQGASLMQQNYSSENQVVIEKTLANAQRIASLEDNVEQLNKKIDHGFESVRIQIEAKLEKISDIVRHSTSDRYTKTEHNSFADNVNSRINRIEIEINDLRREIYLSKKIKTK